MTPDQDLSARLAKLMQAVKSAQNDTDCGVTPFLNKRALYVEALIAAHTSGQLITLADHTSAVAKAVEAEREACAAIIDAHMLCEASDGTEVLHTRTNPGNKTGVAYAAAIRSRGVAG